MIRAAVVGATGYTGAELFKILLRHPHVRVTRATSESQAGKRLPDVHPFLGNRLDLPLEKFNARALAADTDVAFFALPHGIGGARIAAYVGFGRRAIDLSADFRLKDPGAYRAWYKVKHASPGLLKKAVYGLPELYRERIPSAQIIANPGCYATATILALAPLVQNGLVVPGSLVVDAKSGVSGAGRKVEAKYLFCEAAENFQAYAPILHRHVPEIEQVLTDRAGRNVSISFVPHLVPMTRGILVTAYGTLRKKISGQRLRALYKAAYGGERFIRLLPEGRWPQTRDVAGNNFVDINMLLDERNRRVVVLAALDNLVKGAAGQAVQNLNLAFGFDEAEALE